MKNLMDIIERFQMHHALQEEREMENSHASGTDSIFETEDVRVGTVAVPGNTEWSAPHDGRDRLVVMLGKIAPLLPEEGDAASPAQGTWIPANSNFKVPNKAHQTRTLLIVEFSGVDREPLTE